MASFLHSSPELAATATFKSPLRSFGADPCERVASEDLYADAQIRLTQWRRDLVGSASFDAQQGIRELCHERDHIRDLQTDLAGIQGLVQAASQLQAGGSRLVQVVQSSSEATSSRAQAASAICDELHRSRELRKQQLDQEDRKIVQQQAAADAHHAEARKLLETYSERLGLAITRVAPHTVRMAFSLLDPCDPKREFFFILGLAKSDGKDGDSYVVQESEPHVPEVSRLLAQLNSDADSVAALPRFVCSMRRAFLKSSTGACKA